MILSSSSVLNHEYEVAIPLELDNNYDDLIGMTLNIIYEVQTNYFTSSVEATFVFQRGDNPTPEGPIMLPNPLLDDYFLILGESVEHDFGKIIFDLAKTPYADVLVEQESAL